MPDELRLEATILAEIKQQEDGLVSGYASTPVVDRGDEKYRDYIPSELWVSALVAFFKLGAKINVLHRNIPGGETVSVDVTASGPLLVTRPTKDWVAAAIKSGDLRGYSIEYVVPKYRTIRPGTDEFRALLPADPLESRSIRYFEDLIVTRVSYVDEPMNQGSYFLGGKSLDLNKYQFRFDREKGTVTIFASTDEAMAEIASLLADELKATRPDIPVTGIVFKIAQEDEPQHEGRRSGLFGRLANALGKEATDEEDTVTPELKALIDGLTAEIAGLKTKVEALEKAPFAKAEDLAALKASVDGLVAGKANADAVAGVTASTATLAADVATVKQSVAEVKSAVDGINAILDKAGKSTVATPKGSPEINDGGSDPWGNGGKGAKFTK